MVSVKAVIKRNAAPHIIFKIARVVPAMPMMIVDVRERINNTQEKNAIFVAAAIYLR